MGKNNLKIYFSIYLFILPFSIVKAQMVNKGTMIIEEGTDNVITLFDFTNDLNAEFINNDGFYVMADYNNRGKVNHEGKGTTFFKELNKNFRKKVIEGGNSTFLYDVVFDSPVSDSNDYSAFDLYGEINIEGQADFKKGIVNNRKTKGVISFLRNGTTIGASDESYVNGKVEKIGDTKFSEFPIGSYRAQQYRFSGISAPKDSEHSVVAEYFFRETNSKYPHNNKDNSIVSIDNNEYWEITGTENLILTLSWDNDTTPQELLDNPESIHIVRWDSSLKKWRDLGGISEITTKTVTAPVSNEGIFTLALAETEIDDIEVFNYISPNGDNLNNKLFINFKEGTKINNLAVRIYNRWGVKVYESDNYMSNDKNIFYGYSNGRSVVNEGSLLPEGTYFYILDYNYTEFGSKNHEGTKVGYLYIDSNNN